MNYFDEIQTFIEESNNAPDLVQLSLIFEKTVKRMGCKYFICASSVDPLNPPEHAIVLTNYPPDWIIRHSEQQYFDYDPVFHTSLNRVTPFDWLDIHWRGLLTLPQINILNEASEMGIKGGYTIPIHSAKGYPASVSIVFDTGQVSNEAIHSIHIISLYLYEKAISMKVNFDQRYKKILSNTQKLILEEIAKGKSDWAISKIIGRSENTVNYHVRNIFAKLGVNTRQQAIVKGLFIGEIRYLDVNVSPARKNSSINLLSMVEK